MEESSEEKGGCFVGSILVCGSGESQKRTATWTVVARPVTVRAEGSGGDV